MRRMLLLWSCLSLPLVSGDLEAIRNEPNLERRSDKALQNAQASLDRARKAYQDGESQAVNAAFDELSESLELCRQSLVESGKNARKRPKYFKKAEIGIRQLIRRLDNFKVEISVDDRAPVEKLVDRAHQVQEELLHSIMGKKK